MRKKYLFLFSSLLIFTAVEIEPIQTLATPIYNPLEPTEEIQPKPESITPQEKSEPEQPAPTPPEDQKLRFLLKKKSLHPRKRQTCGETGNVKRKKETNKRNSGSSPTSE